MDPIQSLAPRGLDQFHLRAGTTACVLLQYSYVVLEYLSFIDGVLIPSCVSNSIAGRAVGSADLSSLLSLQAQLLHRKVLGCYESYLPFSIKMHVLRL